jgi:ABC-type lipoprotein release transport system permease subunit
MAWRNIWRNPRRTMVILIAIVIGIFAMITSSALMRGFEKSMIKKSLSTLTGEVQIHDSKYLADPVVENSIEDPSVVETAIKEVLPDSTDLTTRVRINAIVSNARHSSRIIMVGIDPEREAGVSFIVSAVNEGRYLEGEDTNAIVVGRALLDRFETGINKKLVLTAQAADMELASGAFRIVGVYDAKLEDTEKRFVFTTKAAAQDMLKIGNAISEAVLVTGERITPEQATQELKGELGAENYSIKTWRELKPMLEAYVRLVDGFTFIWNIVIFIAMGFGIVNTTLMAVFERIREFGLFKALGMKPRWILKQVVTESFLLLFMGAAGGNLLALLAVWALSGGIDLSSFAAGMKYVGFSKVIYPTVYAQDLASANLTVFILGLLVSLYPAGKAARFMPVEALIHT